MPDDPIYATLDVTEQQFRLLEASLGASKRRCIMKWGQAPTDKEKTFYWDLLADYDAMLQQCSDIRTTDDLVTGGAEAELRDDDDDPA